ncbi:MAG: hypothetical protein H6741_27265 [Alphaproteobacteria bacterium]|nr:hypothetical protein [Alphaproteobacteria bacterium]
MADRTLILAGPVVRHVEPHTVTVWVALSEPCSVELRLYHQRQDAGAASNDMADVQAPLQGSASRATVALGDHLHVVAVTVELTGGYALQAGQVYSYNLVFTGQPIYQDLRSLGLLRDGNVKVMDGAEIPRPQLALGYAENMLPSFATPPQELDGLRLAHGSCRKLHGQGPDALPHLDSLIAASLDDAEGRPQQLFLTGDQIYADDVAPMLLPHLHAVGRGLLWADAAAEEHLDMRGTDVVASMRNLPSGWRTWPTRYFGAFSQGDSGRSHLMTLSEYCAAYLFAWGNMAWPVVDEGNGVVHAHPDEVIAPDPVEADLPDIFGSGTLMDVWAGTWPGLEVLGRLLPPSRLEAILADPRVEYETDPDTGELVVDPQAPQGSTDAQYLTLRAVEDFSGLKLVLLRDMGREWYHGLADWHEPSVENPDAERLRTFYEGLPKVRRALANVATWMIFDDHDVTDDWFLSQRWCINNIQRATGRANIRNALVAYTAFQGWGNDPDKWVIADSEKSKLLAKLPAYAATIKVAQPPTGDALTTQQSFDTRFGLKLSSGKPAKSKITWSYIVDGPRHRVFVMDQRTVRYFAELDTPPMVVPPKLVKAQIAAAPRPQDHVTFVVSSLPVLGHPAFDELVHPVVVRLFGAAATKNLAQADDPDEQRARDPGAAHVEPEHWPMQPEAREFLLKRLAGHTRVILLSGEVHYSSANAMDYWAKEEDEATGQDVLVPKARVLQLISSAMRNAEPSRVLRPIDGAVGQWFAGHALTMASDDDGFGSVLQAPPQAELELPGTPLVRYGWKSSGDTMVLPAGELAPLQHRSGLNSTPTIVHNRCWPDGTTFGRLPDWAWAAYPVMDTRPDVERSPRALPALPTPGATDGDNYAAALTFHGENAGHEIARRFSYRNHIGVVRFTGGVNDLRVRQELYTIREDEGDLDYFPYLVHETRMTLTTADPPPISTFTPGGAT